jgi:curved DNA-binding protein CbpA
LSTPPQPVVRGVLRQTPLAEFLVQAYDGGLEGTLLLQTPEREKSAILFVRGAPAKARPASNEVFLGKVATDLGLIEAPIAASTFKKSKAEGRPHGTILLEQGHLDETGLYLALREQLKRQVLRLCDLPDTTGYGFYEANYLAEWGPSGEWRVKPLPMVWRALADHLPPARRDAWLARLGETPLKIRPVSPVSRYALTPQEKAVVDMLRALPVPLSKLEESGVGSSELVRKVVCALLLSRQFELGSQKEPVGLREPPESPQSVPPPETRAARRGVTFSKPPGVPRDIGLADGPVSDGALPSVPPARASTNPRGSRATTGRVGSSSADGLRATIEAYLASSPRNHYERLGIPQDANTATIRAAFFQLARVWHPDRLPKELEDLKPAVTRTFALMGEAHQMLSDEKKRADYDAILKETPDDEQAQVATILEAAGAFQRAEILMKKKDYKGALKEAQTAFELDPGQADHAALYAWIQGLEGNGDLAELIQVLDSAIEKDQGNVNALWYRGQLLKKAGHTLRAIKDFKEILKIKPKHMEAQRELRVHTMRKRSDGDAQNSGFFGVFKKK